MAQHGTDAHKVLPLVALVRRRLDELGGWANLREFAKTRKIPYSTLQRFTDVDLEPQQSPPRQSTMQKLALALEVPLPEVEKAAVASVGYVYREQLDDATTVSFASFEKLTEAQKRRQAKQIYDVIKDYLPES